jgi:hypothetical protein
VSRVAGEGAKLTEATDATDVRRRPRDGGEPSAEFHGRVRRARERESEGVQSRAQLDEGSERVWAAEKGSGAGVVAGKRAVMGVSTTESASGRVGKRGVTDRRAVSANRKALPSSERERARVRADRRRRAGPTGLWEGEGASERSLLTGGVRLSGDAGARGLAGLDWA